MISRPRPEEHNPYFSRYIDLVPAGDVFALLEEQHQKLERMLTPLSETQARHRYAAGKWSVVEVVGHLSDTERIFAYRALRIARGDATPLPGFEENDYVPAARLDRRSLGDVWQEFSAVRQASIALFRGFDDQAIDAVGTAAGSRVSVRALLYMIAGHERHHTALLTERYGITAAT